VCSSSRTHGHPIIKARTAAWHVRRSKAASQRACRAQYLMPARKTAAACSAAAVAFTATPAHDYPSPPACTPLAPDTQHNAARPRPGAWPPAVWRTPPAPPGAPLARWERTRSCGRALAGIGRSTGDRGLSAQVPQDGDMVALTWIPVTSACMGINQKDGETEDGARGVADARKESTPRTKRSDGEQGCDSIYSY
jgi:hypothetical protein